MLVKRRHLSLSVIGLAVLAGAVAAAFYWQRDCDGGPVPGGACEAGRTAHVHPDYSGSCLPPNIAPINFVIDESGTRFCVHIYCPSQEGFTVYSRSGHIVIPVDAWRSLLHQNRGGQLVMDVYARDEQGNWSRFDSIKNSIAREEIDGYVSYRLLTPIHVLSANMGTYQRELTGFRQSPILESKEGTSQRCVNCHTYVNNDPDTMLLHLRGAEGLAMLVSHEGKVTKISARSNFRPWPASYSAWHPGGHLLAVSFNTMVQFFHTAGHGRDVFIFDSDLGLYLTESNRIISTPAISDPSRMETFPSWSPDGKYLYFSSAERRWKDNSGPIPPVYREVKFDLMRIAYDAATNTWGKLETVLTAQDTGRSILEPRVSPDGRYVLVAMCDYGAFPVFQESSDLYFVETATGKYWPLPVNSDQSDSWHAWSSNGRWIVFASKRDSGVFGRLYFAHVDADGQVAKPFVLPQEDPSFYDTNLNNFNAPEFTTKAVGVKQRQFLEAIYQAEEISAAYDSAGMGDLPTPPPLGDSPVRME
jgi:hypothetical protein